MMSRLIMIDMDQNGHHRKFADSSESEPAFIHFSSALDKCFHAWNTLLHTMMKRYDTHSVECVALRTLLGYVRTV